MGARHSQQQSPSPATQSTHSQSRKSNRSKTQINLTLPTDDYYHRRPSKIKKGLPPSLQEYSSAISALSNFWFANVTSLLENPLRKNDYETMCILLYSNIFRRIPQARRLFLSFEKKNNPSPLRPHASHRKQMILKQTKTSNSNPSNS